MLVAGPTAFPGELVDFSKEKAGYICIEYALIIFGKNAGIEGTLVELAIQEPHPQEVVAQLFAERAFATHGEKGNEQTGFEELLWGMLGRPSSA